jgi:hypothetical protein
MKMWMWELLDDTTIHCRDCADANGVLEHQRQSESSRTDHVWSATLFTLFHFPQKPVRFLLHLNNSTSCIISLKKTRTKKTVAPPGIHGTSLRKSRFFATRTPKRNKR